MPNRLLSHCKWNTRTSLFPPYLAASLFGALDVSLSRTASSMANCKRIFFCPPSLSPSFAWLYYFQKKNPRHSQPNLLVTAKPLLSFTFSLRRRFLVELLPAQMSSLMMFLIHTQLPSCPSVDEPGMQLSALSPAVSCLWTNRLFICPGFKRTGLCWLDK